MIALLKLRQYLRNWVRAEIRRSLLIEFLNRRRSEFLVIFLVVGNECRNFNGLIARRRCCHRNNLGFRRGRRVNFNLLIFVRIVGRRSFGRDDNWFRSWVSYGLLGVIGSWRNDFWMVAGRKQFRLFTRGLKCWRRGMLSLQMIRIGWGIVIVCRVHGKEFVLVYVFDCFDFVRIHWEELVFI